MKAILLKGIVYPKRKNLSWFRNPQVFNSYDFLSSV